MFVQTSLQEFLSNLITILTSFNFILNLTLFVLGISALFIIQFLILAAVKRIKNISLDMVNGIKILLRLTIAVVVLMIITSLFGLPPQATFLIGAVFGAVISFSSAQIIQNFVSGLYLLLTRPFIVGDLIAIGDREGVVVEISLNYTKLRTTDTIYQLTPNRIILNTPIVNYNHWVKKKAAKAIRGQQRDRFTDILSKSREVRYSFDWGVPIGNLAQDKMKINQICEKYESLFGHKPEFFLVKVSHRLKFKFIIRTDTGEKIINFANDFRNELVSLFH
ncbi:MAG: mechanosensitive ion channel family protein [Candidatus Hodarchaeota archaeon]